MGEVRECRQRQLCGLCGLGWGSGVTPRDTGTLGGFSEECHHTLAACKRPQAGSGGQEATAEMMEFGPGWTQWRRSYVGIKVEPEFVEPESAPQAPPGVASSPVASPTTTQESPHSAGDCRNKTLKTCLLPSQ